MPSDLITAKFPDENDWPFLGRVRELERCLTFLKPDESDAPSRLLHIAGESGAGKSFFAKEIICRFTERAPSSLGLYINVEESEFESAEIEKRLALIASYPAEPTRKDPQHIPVNAEMAKYLRPLPRWLQTLRYTYGGLREATADVPVLGNTIKALLPQELPVSKRREMVAAGRFWDYLIATARRDPVLLVIDNFQFLPDSVAMEIDMVLAIADTGFRLLTVERLREGVSEARKLRCFAYNRLSLELAALTHEETRKLVDIVLGAEGEGSSEIGDVMFRKSGGNPKQVWLQLRAYQLSQHRPEASENHSLETRQNPRPVGAAAGGYDETIQNLPALDRLALQLVTLLMGGLKLDDLVRILRSIVHSLSEEDVRRAILDLTLVGLLIVNGTQNNRVRIEHELVSRSVRRLTTEEDTLELRHDVVSALSHRLEHALEDEEYERLVDRLIGLLAPEEIRRHELLAHLIALVDRQHSKEHFHYLASLFGTPCCGGAVDLLPSHCLEAFLDAFQKTSQFDKGLAAVALMRANGNLSPRKMALFAAKYLVQKFEYSEAESTLRQLDPGSDRDVVLFNILLNLCRDSEARRMVEALPRNANQLDEYQCVMLRNSSHLYNEDTARRLLTLAKDGFRRLGLKFGEATALNNLGVLELWTGRYDDARRHLTAALSTLEALGSNEVYQPLTNMAVLHAVEGDVASARHLLDQARTAVSPWLKMDDIMLRLNQLTIELIEGSVSGIDAAAKANELYEHGFRTMDMRFRDVLAWFANQMETLFVGSSSIPLPPDFETTIRDGRRSGLEVFSEVYVDGQKLSTVFVLSPHWRY